VNYRDPLLRHYCAFWMHVYDDIIRMIQKEWINSSIRLDHSNHVHPQELLERNYKLNDMLKNIYQSMSVCDEPVPIPNITDWSIICDEKYLRVGTILLWLVGPDGLLYSLEHLAKKDIREIEYIMES
jgi:hypothetical protein